MLTPHHRKDSQLGEIRFAPENFFDPLEFFRRETVFRHKFRSNNRIGGRCGARHRQRTVSDLGRDSTRSFRKTGRIPAIRRVSNYKEKGENMKRSIAIFASAVLAMFLSVNPATAFPGERMPSRAAHFAGKVADKVDKHVVHPVTHGVARRLR